jgi:hypothetical protein
VLPRTPLRLLCPHRMNTNRSTLPAWRWFDRISWLKSGPAKLLREVAGVDHTRKAQAHGRIRSSKLVECSAFNGKLMKLASVRHDKKRGALAANVMVAV